MVYYVRIKKEVRYVKVYNILNKIGKKENLLTRLFIKLLSKLIKDKSIQS